MGFKPLSIPTAEEDVGSISITEESQAQAENMAETRSEENVGSSNTVLINKIVTREMESNLESQKASATDFTVLSDTDTTEINHLRTTKLTPAEEALKTPENPSRYLAHSNRSQSPGNSTSADSSLFSTVESPFFRSDFAKNLTADLSASPKLMSKETDEQKDDEEGARGKKSRHHTDHQSKKQND